MPVPETVSLELADVHAAATAAAGALAAALAPPAPSPTVGNSGRLRQRSELSSVGRERHAVGAPVGEAPLPPSLLPLEETSELVSSSCCCSSSRYRGLPRPSACGALLLQPHKHPSSHWRRDSKPMPEHKAASTLERAGSPGAAGKIH